jgi:hypothetical protein
MIADNIPLVIGDVNMKGWPDSKNDLPENLRLYFSYRGNPQPKVDS